MSLSLQVCHMNKGTTARYDINLEKLTETLQSQWKEVVTSSVCELLRDEGISFVFEFTVNLKSLDKILACNRHLEYPELNWSGDGNYFPKFFQHGEMWSPPLLGSWLSKDGYSCFHMCLFTALGWFLLFTRSALIITINGTQTRAKGGSISLGQFLHAAAFLSLWAAECLCKWRQTLLSESNTELSSSLTRLLPYVGSHPVVDTVGKGGRKEVETNWMCWGRN